MRSLQRFLSGVTVAFLALLSAVPAYGAPVEFKFGVATGEGHHYNLGGMAIKRAVEKATNGEAVIHFYAGGQLANGERELVEGLQFGTVDICLVSTGPMAIWDPNFMFFTLPYLFDSEEQVYGVVDGEIGKAFETSLAKSGIKLLGWAIDGVKSITTSTRAVNTLADLKGLKIRCMENPMIIATWKALGAFGTPMSLGETFTALQQGTVDGQENGTANIYANKYYEVQKHMAVLKEMITPAPFLMAAAKFESMSPELREKFLKGFREGIMEQRAIYEQQAADAIPNMEAKGVAVTQPDLTEFKKAVDPVYAEFLPKMSPEVRAWVKAIRK